MSFSNVDNLEIRKEVRRGSIIKRNDALRETFIIKLESCSQLKST